VTKRADTYSVNALSINTGYDRATITKALTDVPADVEDGKGRRWKLKTALQALGAVKERMNAREINPVDQERARLTRVQAERQELKLARESGDYIPTELGLKVFEDIAMDMRAKLLAIPSKAAPRMIGITKERDAKTKLEKMIHEVLVDFSRTSPDRFLGELRKLQGRTSQDVPAPSPAPEANNKRVGRNKKTA
jgi:phage terminase Nu1 subunit (DNA packaging protein)